jgi:hypothetical protein
VAVYGAVSLSAKLEANKGYVVIPSTFRADEEGYACLSWPHTLKRALQFQTSR